MKLAEIRELMETFDGMNICRLELEDGAFSLVLSKEHTPAQPPHWEEPSRRREPELRPMPPVEAEAAAELTPAVPETPAPAVTEGEAVTAPVVGVFYSASATGRGSLCEGRGPGTEGSDPLHRGSHEDDERDHSGL